MRLLIHRHIGVRAEGMILAAGIWCLVGLGVITGPAQALIPSVWHLLIPPPITAALWIGTGLAGAVLAPFRRASEAGLVLLLIAPALRFTSYLWGWLAEVIPGPPPGDPRGWFSALFYAAMLAFVILLSHIPADVRSPLTGKRA
jgi:hypothetical protein